MSLGAKGLGDHSLTDPSTGMQRYQQESLRMLLMRRLDREADEDAALERLDEIWYHYMSDEDRHAADSWVRSLPAELRKGGPDIESGWERASGDVECPTCGLTYLCHPVDPREELFELHVTCNGKRWKL